MGPGLDQLANKIDEDRKRGMQAPAFCKVLRMLVFLRADCCDLSPLVGASPCPERSVEPGPILISASSLGLLEPALLPQCSHSAGCETAFLFGFIMNTVAAVQMTHQGLCIRNNIGIGVSRHVFCCTSVDINTVRGVELDYECNRAGVCHQGPRLWRAQEGTAQ